MVNKASLQKTSHEVDIIVAGAGLIGLAAVVALQATGKRVALVDAKTYQHTSLTKALDARVYAITPANEDWLHALDVWPLVDETRVANIEAMALWNTRDTAVDDALMLSADDANLDKLACIVENKNLMRALWAKVKALGIPVFAGSACKALQYTENAITLHLENGNKMSAELIIAADGVNSFVRQYLNIATHTKVFNQTALVANYLADNGHSNIARQWFAPQNTLALLPLPGQQVSMVWSVSTKLANELLSLTEQQLAERVEGQAKNALGGLKPISQTFSFELNQVTTSKLIAKRIVFAGDAAHQVHPMAGQGANLGFRDIMALQAIIASSHHLQDIGEESYLRQYERERKADILSMNTLTSGLNSLFAIENAGISRVTASAMKQLNKFSAIKRVLIKQAVA